MIELHPQFVVDENGNRIAVQIDLEQYEKLLAEIATWREWIADISGPDPDANSELMAEIHASLEAQMAAVKNGERGQSLKEIMQELGGDSDV